MPSKSLHAMAAVWSWFEDQLSDDCRSWSLVPYDAGVASVLESAFTSGQSVISVPGKQEYQVDFSTMSQLNTRTGTTRHVLRGDLPVSWEWQNDDGASWMA